MSAIILETMYAFFLYIISQRYDFIGTLASAAVGAIGSIFGGIKAAKEAQQVRQQVENQRRKNQNWRDRIAAEEDEKEADRTAALAQMREQSEQSQAEAVEHTSLVEDTTNGVISPLTMTDKEKGRRGDLLRNSRAVDVSVGVITATQELSARKAAEKWWDENVGAPVLFDTEVGEVEISRNSVESSLAHRYGQKKLDAITSLVDGFENAVYLGTMPDSRERGVVDHYFAYPINYDGELNYVFCRAMKDANKNRLYVHEVFVADNIRKGDTLQTAASKPHGGISLYKDILANVLEYSESKGSDNQELSNTQEEKILALDRIPKTEDGEPLYEKSDPDTAYDAIVEQTEGDEDTAVSLAQRMLEKKEVELKKAEKAKAKDGKIISEMIAAENERKAAIEKARADVQFWSNTVKVRETRALAKSAAEAEERRKLQEEKTIAEAQAAEAMEQEDRIARESSNGVPTFEQDKPTDAAQEPKSPVPTQKKQQPKPKKSTIKLKDYISKDEKHPVLKGIFYENGYAIASDAYILIADKQSYEASKEGKLYDAKGNEMQVKADRNGRIYPIWERVIPAKSDSTIGSVAALDAQLGAIDNAITEAIREGVEDFGIKLKSAKENANKKPVVIIMPDGSKKYLLAGSVRRFIEAAKHIEATDIEFATENPTRAIVARSDNGVVILMPFYRESSKEYDELEPLVEIKLDGEHIQSTAYDADAAIKAADGQAQEEATNTGTIERPSLLEAIKDLYSKGKSLSEEESNQLVSLMEASAEVAHEIELTPENWAAQFGKDGKVETPIGQVKMGENQLAKLFLKKRTKEFGMIRPTLTNPDVVIEKFAPAEKAERDTKYLFVKTFNKPNGGRIIHFESVTVSKDGMEVSISSHEVEATSIKKRCKMEKSCISVKNYLSVLMST